MAWFHRKMQGCSYYTFLYLEIKDSFSSDVIPPQTGRNHFIGKCRAGYIHDYDIVEGPMADDTVWNFVNDFLNGDISREVFWAYAKFKHPTHQISFHSIRALGCLRFESKILNQLIRNLFQWQAMIHSCRTQLAGNTFPANSFNNVPPSVSCLSAACSGNRNRRYCTNNYGCIYIVYQRWDFGF